MTMRRASVLAAALLLAFPLAAALAGEKLGGEASEIAVVTSTVEKIDLAAREVTLKGEDGRSETVKVDPEVRNLPQVRVGDRVTVKYYRSIAIFVTPPGGLPSVSETSALQRAALGEKPSGRISNVVEATVNVEAVDLEKRTVTVRGPKGNVAVVGVGDRVKHLDRIKAGDQVVTRYVEAVAVSVEAPE